MTFFLNSASSVVNGDRLSVDFDATSRVGPCFPCLLSCFKETGILNQARVFILKSSLAALHSFDSSLVFHIETGHLTYRAKWQVSTWNLTLGRHALVTRLLATNSQRRRRKYLYELTYCFVEQNIFAFLVSMRIINNLTKCFYWSNATASMLFL